MPDFLVRFNGKSEIIYEIVREKSFRDSKATGKNVSRHSLVLELLEAGIEAKKNDPKWREVIEQFRR